MNDTAQKYRSREVKRKVMYWLVSHHQIRKDKNLLKERADQYYKQLWMARWIFALNRA